MRIFSAKHLLMLSLLAFTAFPVFAQNDDTRKAVRYLNPVFDNVTIQKDIEFGEVINFEGQTEKLLLDCYSPAGDSENKRPVILWMHGGGFRPGNDKSQTYIVKLSNDFAKRGYVCVSVNYRIRNSPKDDKAGTISDALKDAMAGLEWIRKNKKTLNIDLHRIIIGGGSAGGILAVNFCTKDNTNSEKWDKHGIIALVNLWGSPDASFLFSAIDKNDPPTIIVHGTADKLVPYENTIQLTRQLNEKGIKNEVVRLEGGEHTPIKFYGEFSEKISRFLYDLISKK